LNEKSEKELLKVLLSARRNQKPSAVYNQSTALFGARGSTLRTQVVNRRKYLERIRVEQPALFFEICRYHGLTSSQPTTDVIESAETDSDASSTDSMSANRYRQRERTSEKVFALVAL
jgi:hypothetical protein